MVSGVRESSPLAQRARAGAPLCSYSALLRACAHAASRARFCARARVPSALLRALPRRAVPCAAAACLAAREARARELSSSSRAGFYILPLAFRLRQLTALFLLSALARVRCYTRGGAEAPRGASQILPFAIFARRGTRFRLGSQQKKTQCRLA